VPKSRDFASLRQNAADFKFSLLFRQAFVTQLANQASPARVCDFLRSALRCQMPT
jgi:hypothetical protein